MKYLPIFLFILLCVGIVLFNQKSNNLDYDYLRIHIRANSNLQIDQDVKYEIKDEVVKFVTPYLIECDTKQKSVDMITSLLDVIEDVCDNILINKGFTYTSRARIDREKFPTRSYENVTLEEGVYDALIIELGGGNGDNWWCIVYPPLCFVNKSETNVQNIQYQSYLMEIIKKYFN
ncbi:MAG: stage II sporulation protein R [Clostridia bacterium]